MEALPQEHFSVIFTDTSLAQSLLAALTATRKQSMSILHVDERKFYGGPEAGSHHIYLKDVVTRDAGLEAINSSLSFVFDPSPLVLMARGPVVEALLDLELADYLEFVAIGRMFLLRWTGEDRFELLALPVSKEEIMLSSQLDLKSKRQLTRFLTKPPSTDSQLPLAAFLQSEGLARDTPLWDLIAYAAVRCGSQEETEGMPMSRALEAISALKASILHLAGAPCMAASPFILPRWGSSELAQAACRRAAVSGASTTQIMNVSVQTDPQDGVIYLGSNPIKAHCSLIARDPALQQQTILHRACVLWEGPSVLSETGNVLITIPPREAITATASLLQLNADTRCVPEGFYLYHLWSVQEGANDVVMRRIFSQKKESIRWTRQWAHKVPFYRAYQAGQPCSDGIAAMPKMPAAYDAERQFIAGVFDAHEHL